MECCEARVLPGGELAWPCDTQSHLGGAWEGTRPAAAQPGGLGLDHASWCFRGPRRDPEGLRAGVGKFLSLADIRAIDLVEPVLPERRKPGRQKERCGDHAPQISTSASSSSFPEGVGGQK